MNGQVRVDQIYAYLAVDPADNTEGVMAFSTPNGMMMPAVGADLERMGLLKPTVEKLAAQLGCEVRLCRFETRTEVETIPAK